MEVIWKAPPGEISGPQPGAEPALAAELGEIRAHPGQPGIVAVFETGEGRKARAMAVNIRQGRYQAARPAGAFQARSATEPLPRSGHLVVNVYAKFIGEHGEHDDGKGC